MFFLLEVDWQIGQADVLVLMSQLISNVVYLPKSTDLFVSCAPVTLDKTPLIPTKIWLLSSDGKGTSGIHSQSNDSVGIYCLQLQSAEMETWHSSRNSNFHSISSGGNEGVCCGQSLNACCMCERAHLDYIPTWYLRNSSESTCENGFNTSFFCGLQHRCYMFVMPDLTEKKPTKGQLERSQSPSGFTGI